MITRTKEDQKLKFPSFFLSEKELDTVTKVKYLGHIMRDDLSDADIQNQRFKLYAQANMLACKFQMCTDDVKITLFRANCTLLLSYSHTSHSTSMV